MSVPVFDDRSKSCSPELELEAADGLADGRLRPMHLGRRARKAALLGDGEKDLQGGQIHAEHYNTALFFVIIITLTSRPPGGYNTEP